MVGTGWDGVNSLSCTATSGPGRQGEDQHHDRDDPGPLAAAPAPDGDDRAVAAPPCTGAGRAGLGVEDLARPRLGADRSRLGARFRRRECDLGQLGHRRSAEPVDRHRGDVLGRVQGERFGGGQGTGQRAQPGRESRGIEPGGRLGRRGPGQHVVEGSQCLVRRERLADTRRQRPHGGVGHERNRARKRLVEHEGQASRRRPCRPPASPRLTRATCSGPSRPWRRPARCRPPRPGRGPRRSRPPGPVPPRRRADWPA